MTLPIVALVGIGWFLFREGKAPLMDRPGQSSKSDQPDLPAEAPRIDANTQTNHRGQKNQPDRENRTRELDQVSHATQSNDVPTEEEFALPKGSLDPSADQSVKFTQRLFQEHLWRHRTDASIKLPDNKTPRIGSISPGAVKAMSEMEGLRTINLSAFRDTNFFADLKSKTLTGLNLAYTDVDDTTVQHFGTNLPNLQRLQLQGSETIESLHLKERFAHLAGSVRNGHQRYGFKVSANTKPA